MKAQPPAAQRRAPPRGACARERIIEEAEHLIHLRGYLGTSLDDIASRCRMTKANLLHHFRSKEALGLAVLDYKIECTRRRCMECLFPEDADPAQAVRELFASAARFHRGNGCRAGCFIANMALEMSDLNDRFRERVGRFFQEWASCIGRNLRRRQAQGRLNASLDPAAAAEAIVALYEGAVMLARARRDPAVIERAGASAAALLEARLPSSNPARRHALTRR